MTREDERAFSRLLLDRLPDVVIIDGDVFPTAEPVIRASIAECSSLTVCLLKTDILSVDFCRQHWIKRREESGDYVFSSLGYAKGQMLLRRRGEDGNDPGSLVDGTLCGTLGNHDEQTKAYVSTVHDLFRTHAVRLLLIDIQGGVRNDRPETRFMAWPDAARRYDGRNGRYLTNGAGAFFVPYEAAVPARQHASEGGFASSDTGGRPMASRLSREVSLSRIRTMADVDDETGVSFYRSFIIDDVLDNLMLPGTYFGRCLVQGTRFCNTDLSGSTLRSSDFKDVDFSHATLAGCDTRSCCLYEVRFAAADLSGADLRRTDLRGCDFTQARMEGTILTRSAGAALVLSDQQRAQIAWADDDGPQPDDVPC